MVGPPKCGKTRLSNQLSTHPLLSSPSLTSLLPYHPTAGVRILTFASTLTVQPPAPHPANAPLDLAVQVEWWDVGGGPEGEGGWGAVCEGLDGVVLAYEGGNREQAGEVRVWGEWFVREAALKQGQVVAWALGAGGTAGVKQVKVTVKEGEGGGGGERTVVVPVVSVKLDVADDAATPQSRAELEQWLGASVFALSRHADFDAYAK